MSEPFLENNLTLEYPFADGESGDILGVVADAMVLGNQGGPYTLEVFTPNFDFLAADPLANAVVRVSGPDGVFLDTSAATSTDLGNGFRSMECVDATNGTRARFVVSVASVATLGGLLAPVEIAAAVSHQTVDGLASLQGLSGEVELTFDDFSTITEGPDGTVTLDFANPEDRVDCSGIDCDRLYGFAGARADGFGSLHIDATECYRLTPHPTIANRLVLRNICSPCTDCDDVATLQNKLVAQADYYHQLAAIHHNQFNRYQRGVAAANAYITDSETRADVVTPEGTISIVERVFNRPYFTQLYLAVVNSTVYRIQVSLTVTITPAGVAAQLTPQSNSFLVQRTLSGGDPLDDFAGFPGNYVFDIDPQDTVGLNSESKRTTIDDGFTIGQWNLAATITFLSGPSPLPAPQVVNKILTPNIELLGSPLTS